MIQDLYPERIVLSAPLTLNSVVPNIYLLYIYFKSTPAHQRSAPLPTSDLLYSHQVEQLHLLEAVLNMRVVVRIPGSENNT